MRVLAFLARIYIAGCVLSVVLLPMVFVAWLVA